MTPTLADPDAAEIFLAQLAGRMRNARRAAEVTQAHAAEICNVSPRAYRDYELGNRAPPLDMLIRFCAGFDQPPEDMILGPRPTAHVLAADTVEMVAGDVLAEFGKTEIAADKAAGFARYAYETSRAKGTEFAAELRALRALMG